MKAITKQKLKKCTMTYNNQYQTKLEFNVQLLCFMVVIMTPSDKILGA